MQFFRIEENAKVSELTTVKSPPAKGYLWLLLERSEVSDLPAVLKKLGKELNPRHLEDIAQVNHPGFYEATLEYEVLIFRSLSNRKDEVRRRLFDSTPFIIFPDLVMTVYDSDNLALPKILENFADEKTMTPKAPRILVEWCLNQLIDNFLETKSSLDHRLNLWQKKLLQLRSRTQQDWLGILDFKTDIRRLKTLCEEQLDLINTWRAGLHMEAAHQKHTHNSQVFINLNDLADHANRMVKLTTQAQQELESLLQLYFTVISNRTNDIMRVVALITGIFLPANLITGIFGMNFTHMPDLSGPYGFTLTLISMFLISGGLLAFFRWRNWL